MKAFMLIFMLFVLTISNAQSPEKDKNNFKKHIYFNIDINNNDSLQLLHADFKKEVPYMIRTKITKGSAFPRLSRRKIENMEFKIEYIVLDSIVDKFVTQKLYIESVEFKCFTDSYDSICKDTITSKSVTKHIQPSREKNIAKFKIVVNERTSNNEDLNRNDNSLKSLKKELLFFNGAILDFEIDDSKLKSKKKDSKGDTEIFNFGGHICKAVLIF